MKISPDRYFKELIATFPMLKQQIESEDSEMIHTRMEVFSDYVLKQIGENNINELKNCLEFQENKIDIVSEKLINAMNVSFCESLLLGKHSDKMESVIILMGTRLKKMYLDYEIYYHKIFNQKD